MSIIIFGDAFSFPDGNAATNRVHTYAKGFHENGISIHVVCFNNQYNTPGDGITNGIHYYHPFGPSKRNKYFILRSWRKVIKYFKTFALINKINKNEKVIAINCWTVALQTLIFSFVLAKYFNFHLILERSEHPLRNFQDSSFKKKQGELKVFIETILCDGIFCISQYLIDFYKTRGLTEKNLFHVPGTVDPERFQITDKSPLDFQYILYCGSLTILKDGVNILVESFSRIAEKFPLINLVLIGQWDSKEEEVIIKDLVIKLKIKTRVAFTGQLKRTEIPAYLNHAVVLALARPKSMVADAGFPSKLTEYLATGIPVVVTDVGEISVYLKDNVNAFLVVPDSVDAFAAKLDFVLSNLKFAQEIALKGKELTSSTFNYNVQVRRMIGFINLLK